MREYTKSKSKKGPLIGHSSIKSRETLNTGRLVSHSTHSKDNTELSQAQTSWTSLKLTSEGWRQISLSTRIIILRMKNRMLPYPTMKRIGLIIRTNKSRTACRLLSNTIAKSQPCLNATNTTATSPADKTPTVWTQVSPIWTHSQRRLTNWLRMKRQTCPTWINITKSTTITSSQPG